MEFYIFFVFFSVVVMPDGEIKSFSRQVTECPKWEAVTELHEPRVTKGEILDWSATCLETKLPLKIPPSEDAVPSPTSEPIPIPKKGMST